MTQSTAGASSSHNNGGSHHAQAQGKSAETKPSGSSRQTKTRTTIPTPSGKWILGKVIGAGSMGKVRLATKEDSNEVVRIRLTCRERPLCRFYSC